VASLSNTMFVFAKSQQQFCMFWLEIRLPNLFGA